MSRFECECTGRHNVFMSPAPWRSSNCILHDLCALCTSVCSVCSLYVLRVLLCVLCTLCARSTPRIVNLITVLSTSIKKNSLRYTYFRQDNRFETHYLCQPAFQPFSPSWPSLFHLPPNLCSATSRPCCLTRAWFQDASPLP